MSIWRRSVIIMLAVILLPVPGWGMDTVQQQRFDQIMQMKMSELTAAAKTTLVEKYPDEDWESYRFPRYTEKNDSVMNGYRIAFKEPELLGGVNSGIPCYCSCDAFGHKSLLACFLKDGKLEEGFDPHGADCAICYGQAMLAFLWSELGATHQEILDGMKVKFARLIESRQ